MKKKKKVSKAAFDRWFVCRHSKPLTDSQIAKLIKARDMAEAELELARTRVDIAMETAFAYEDCHAAWEAAQEACNG